MTLPDPLVPLSCDLRGVDDMPVNVRDMLGSALTKQASGEEFRATMLLLCASWHRVPAASLPDDDAYLASLCGMSLRQFLSIKDAVMSDWVKCRDGRLYHPELANRAIDAWHTELRRSYKAFLATNRKRRQRANVTRDTEKCHAGQDAMSRVTYQTDHAKNGVQVVEIPTFSEWLERYGFANVTRDTEKCHAGQDAMSRVTPHQSPSRNNTRASNIARARQSSTHSKDKDKDKEKIVLPLTTFATVLGAQCDANPAQPDKGAKLAETQRQDLRAEDVEEDEARGMVADPVQRCPHQAILDAWVDILPTLPRHRIWTQARRAALQARWREMVAEKGWTTQQEGIEWFRRFFAYIAKSDFLMGRTQGQYGRPPFVCELEWLIRPSNFVKTLEGKYHHD